MEMFVVNHFYKTAVVILLLSGIVFLVVNTMGTKEKDVVQIIKVEKDTFKNEESDVDIELTSPQNNFFVRNQF